MPMTESCMAMIYIHIYECTSRRKNSYEVSKEKRMWVGRLKDLITYGWQIKDKIEIERYLKI